MKIIIVKDNISLDEVKKIAENQYGNMLKAVVDIEKETIAVGGELHADAAELLIEKENSDARNIWGINIYPQKTGDDLIIFDSLVNIKPLLNNRTLYVEDEEIRNKIKKIIDKLIV